MAKMKSNKICRLANFARKQSAGINFRCYRAELDWSQSDLNPCVGLDLMAWGVQMWACALTDAV